MNEYQKGFIKKTIIPNSGKRIADLSKTDKQFTMTFYRQHVKPVEDKLNEILQATGGTAEDIRDPEIHVLEDLYDRLIYHSNELAKFLNQVVDHKYKTNDNEQTNTKNS